jgi:APA family basic amino acid/polyamine antiporter
MREPTESVISRPSMISTRERGASELVRGLGVWSATAAVVGVVIGTSIFLVGSEVAHDTASAALSVAAWIVGGLLALCGALCLAELGAAMPRAGGMYAYLTRGLGPAWGFLYGWTSSTIVETAACAGIAAGFIRLVGFLMPAAATPLFFLHIPGPFHAKTYEFAFTTAQPLAAGVIVIVTAINYLSVRLGGRIQLLTSSLKVGAIAALIVLGFVSQKGNFASLGSGSTAIGAGTAGAFLAALVPVMWAYSGWHLLGPVGEEVENPGKNIPRALLYGMLAVIALYVLANFVYLRVLGIASVAHSSHVASDVLEMLVGKGGAKWLTIAMLISALGCLHVTILTAARIPFAMARDGLFFKFAERVQPTFRSPSGGLLLVGGVTALLALSGTYEELYSLVIFALWIFLCLSAFALIRLRITEPALPRPYRTWGYPCTPILFLVGGLAMTVNLWLDRPVRSSIGLGVILLGLPFYFLWRKSRSDGRVSPNTGV